MPTALIDQNTVNAKNAVLNTDTVQGKHLVRIKIDPITHGMAITTTATISFTMVPIVDRDDNYRTCMTFTGADGLVYPWVATVDGEVLVDAI